MSTLISIWFAQIILRHKSTCINFCLDLCYNNSNLKSASSNRLCLFQTGTKISSVFGKGKKQEIDQILCYNESFNKLAKIIFCDLISTLKII